jgi:hypothetical protein
LIPTQPDNFERWFHVPIGEESIDPRFDVRRARPEDFERVYDTVDQAFGTRRPRALFDWLYRDNPYGLAQVWIVEDRESGEILKTGAEFPWPVWRGDQSLLGTLSGDAATLPHWQRKGLSVVRRHVRQSHPWYPEFCSISGPNESSRIVTKKAGLSNDILGALKGGVALFHTQDVLARTKVPAPIARPIAIASDAIAAGWQRLAARAGRGSGERLEEVSRFTTDFDPVTERTMAWPRFWCPHNADFLNWRYLDHPVETYVGLALIDRERPIGYAVVRLSGAHALLAEFAVESEPRSRAIHFLNEVMNYARHAGSSYMTFFAPPAFRHWGLLHRASFLPYRTRHYLDVGCRRLEPEVQQMSHWQVTPGDRDFR